jgi:hypothetical protein
MIETITNPHAAAILHAIIGMGLLHLLMFAWMYATRLPAMQGMDPQEGAHTRDLAAKLSSKSQRVADNYNHLAEAPTIFYAVAIAIVLLGLADPVNAWCAWAFLALRVLHSVVQATFNRVIVRFALFSLSWIMLGTMIVRAALASF